MRDELVEAVADEWRPVIGWPAYEVSRGGSIRKASGEPVGQWMSDQGYMLARLSKPRAMVRVHRLVAAAFVTNPDNLPNVNHINNDRADNRAGNLEWCTQAQNLAHADKQGRMQRDYWTGVRSPNARLCDDQVRAFASAMPLAELAWSRWGHCSELASEPHSAASTGRPTAMCSDNGWRSIETAPRDGRPILLFARAVTATAPVIVVGWHLPEQGWIESSFSRPVGIVPTHWQPLPEPPAIRAGQGERG